jgi:Reverse transcriptase (RNA-dependent DNA polymerase)
MRAPLEMATPGTAVYRETLDALNVLRSGTSEKVVAGDDIPSLSEADAGAIMKIARRHKQSTDRLHRIWEGGSKAKFKHTRDVYLSAFPTRVCATVRVFAKTGRRGPLQDIYQFAAKVDVWEVLSEPVRAMLLPKPKGGFRGITMHGPRRMAQQFIVRDVLTAVGLDNEHDYSRRGAGGEKALIRDACQLIEDGYWHWQIVGVVKCFASLKPGHLGWLPLPKELIRNVVFLPKCAKLEVVKKAAASWGDTLLYPSDELTTKTVRRGLPQGSVLSPLVARAFLGREIRAALGKKEVATFRFVDDLTLGARSQPKLEHALEALRERLQGHPAGPILLHVEPPTSVQYGRVKVFGYVLEPGRGYGDNSVHVYPRRKRFDRFHRKLYDRWKAAGQPLEVEALDDLYLKGWLVGCRASKHGPSSRSGARAPRSTVLSSSFARGTRRNPRSSRSRRDEQLGASAEVGAYLALLRDRPMSSCVSQ